MFVVEKLINDHREAVQEWERKRNKWVHEGSMYHRTNRLFEQEHPRPGAWVKTLGKILLIAGISGILIAVVVSTIAQSVAENKKHPHPKTPVAVKVEPAKVQKTGDSCGKFKIHDHVRIQYGDYEGDTGRIIGGCNGSESYQVKIDHGQKAQIEGDGNSDPVDVGNSTISVDSSSNLVVIKE